MGKRSGIAASDPRRARGAVLGHVLAASIRVPTLGSHASSHGSERSRRPVGGDCQPRCDEKRPPKTGGGQRAAPQDLLVDPKALPGTDFPPLLLSAVSRRAESPGLGQRGGDGP